MSNHICISKFIMSKSIDGAWTTHAREAPFGKMFSFGWFMFLIIVFPKLVRNLWPTFIENLGTGKKITIVVGFLLSWALPMAITVTIFTSYNIFMYFVYTRKWPFFEQYRVSDVHKLTM